MASIPFSNLHFKKSPYPLTERARVFIAAADRSSHPLVEVAMTGLKKPELPEKLQTKYARRIAKAGTVDDVFDILKLGAETWNTARSLCSIIKNQGTVEQAISLLTSHEYWDMQRYAGLIEKICEQGTAQQAFDVFMSGKVKSGDAQLALAKKIYEQGTVNQAFQLVLSGVIEFRTKVEFSVKTDQEPQLLLLAKIRGEGTLEQVKYILTKDDPPILLRDSDVAYHLFGKFRYLFTGKPAFHAQVYLDFCEAIEKGFIRATWPRTNF